MSFRIDDLLKPDNVERSSKTNKFKNGTASQITHLHQDFDEMGGMLHYHPHHQKSLKNKLDDGFFKHEDQRSEKPSSSDGTANRKRRILFTREQTYELQKVFQYQQYLTVPQRDYLSRKINLTPTQVKIWFQNHRYKLKKYVKECNTKTKGKYSFFDTKSSIGSVDHPAYSSDRSPPYSREIRHYKRHASPERPTMYPLSKSYTRYGRPDKDLFTSTMTSQCSDCCDCDRYTPPPLIKWKTSSTSDAGCSSKGEGD